MKGDVGMSHHEKEREQEDPYTKTERAIHNPILHRAPSRTIFKLYVLTIVVQYFISATTDCVVGLWVSACSNMFINHASCITSLSYHPYMPLLIRRIFYLLVIHNHSYNYCVTAEFMPAS